MRKGEQHGFTLPESVIPDYLDFSQSPEGRAFPDVRTTNETLLRGKQHGGNAIRVYSALFEGRLTVANPVRFRVALESGIGHGKVMGLGLLSVVPVS